MYQLQPRHSTVVRARVSVDLLERIQSWAGERGVSEFIRAAAEAEVDRLERMNQEKARLLSRN